MGFAARIEPQQEAGNRRRAKRHSLSLGSALGISQESVIIHDLSTEGLLIETAAGLNPGDLLEIDLPEVGSASAQVLWGCGRYFGCEFENGIPVRAISAALLRNPIRAPSEVRSQTGQDNENVQHASGAGETHPLGLATVARVQIALSLASWGLVALLALLILRIT